jgi:glucose-1-phosphate cytidylyltransferase
MDILILAGGRGTRLGETGKQTPKALVQVAGNPLIQHVFNAFEPGERHRIFILAGYKVSDMFKYFRDNWPYRVTKHGAIESMITGHDFVIIDTGYFTETGGRILAASKIIKDLSDPFMVTYCDSIANIDIDELLRVHNDSGADATITAVRPVSRFGNVKTDGNAVTEFREKQQQDELVNGGFIIMNHNAIPAANIPLEVQLHMICQEGKLAAYLHDGYWTCVDAERDIEAAELWIKGGRK